MEGTNKKGGFTRKKRTCMRSALKWGTLSLALCLAVLSIPQNILAIRYVWRLSFEGEGIWLGGGNVGYCSYVVVLPKPRKPQCTSAPAGLSVGRPLARSNKWVESRQGSLGVRICTCTLCPFFLASAAVTGLLWFRWRDGSTIPDHCSRCGYNLTGNMSGICPECGRQLHT
jgi:hypothetical protein